MIKFKAPEMTLKLFKKVNLKKIFDKALHQKTSRRVIIGLGAAILGVAVFFFSFNLIYQDKVLPRTFIGEKNFGGMTSKEAKATLNQLINRSQDQQLNFKGGDFSYNISLKELEVNYNKLQNKTIDNLLSIGRQGALGKIISQTLKSIFTKNTIRASFDYDKTELNEFLMLIAKDIDKEERDATIEIEDNEAVVISEQLGQKFSLAENRSLTLEHIGSFSFDKLISFRIEKILPKISSQVAQEALTETQALMGRQLTLKAGDKTFQIYPQDVSEMIEFVARLKKDDEGNNNDKNDSRYILSPEISTAKVFQLTEKISSEIYQEPRDPDFEVSGSKVVAFQLAQTGYELEKEKSVDQIIEAIKKDQKAIELPVKITEPTIASNNPEEIGLKELIGEGTTNFSGSPKNRRHNISVGANSFDGVLVKPGEEFSMIKYLGPVEASTGYLPELVIKEDRTIPEYGGGLCQVSTTMFRATLNAGLNITERQNHSYRVRYYEPPVGMDATIYIPKPDFKFVNNFESHVLIQAVISGNNLTFKLYGTKDGRRSETTTPYVYDVTGSGEAIYTESPDLAPGEIKKIESAHPGSKASFTYTVFDKDDKLIEEQKFTSSYVPWPARYLYGPGTTVPPVEAPAE